MKVKELIEVLKNKNPEAVVLYPYFDNGFSTVNIATETNVVPESNSSYLYEEFYFVEFWNRRCGVPVPEPVPGIILD